MTETSSPTPTERPDLNGRRLVLRGDAETWLVFHGRRHLVPDDVGRRLFRSTDLTVAPEVDSIVRGPDLHPEALLVRSGEEGPVYLLTSAYEGGVRKHLIPSKQDMDCFDFDDRAPATLPPLVVGAIPAGRDLVASA